MCNVPVFAGFWSRIHSSREARGDVILNERVSADGKVRWQARRSNDRGRLVVVGVVAPSDTETLVEPLNERELRELLEGRSTTVTLKLFTHLARLTTRRRSSRARTYAELRRDLRRYRDELEAAAGDPAIAADDRAWALRTSTALIRAEEAVIRAHVESWLRSTTPPVAATDDDADRLIARPR